MDFYIFAIILKQKKKFVKVKIVNKSSNELPAYETIASAGVDLRADLQEEIVLKPMERSLIPTGLYIELPIGFEAQVRPVLNSPGTIDADYRGEIKVILINLSTEDFIIKNGERIAQMIIAKHEQAEWQAVEVLNETVRGEGGFGHTGQ